MQDNQMLQYITEVLENMPQDWLRLTTHRLDIYDESLAKVEFIEYFEKLFNNHNSNTVALTELPTAYDYIRLGHPLSCVLEWLIAKENQLNPEHVISFSSSTMPIMAILRKNFLLQKNTQILYSTSLPQNFNADILRRVYGYQFELKKVDHLDDIPSYEGSTIFLAAPDSVVHIDADYPIDGLDFYISMHAPLGSILSVHGQHNAHYISDIQHVRRRETIAMTPINCLAALRSIIHRFPLEYKNTKVCINKEIVQKSIQTITHTTSMPLMGSSGLSVQYAIMMGLIDYAQKYHPGKAIKFVVPPNCYGGTNDQARRVAACQDIVEIVDLRVDGDHDMVESIETVLAQIALQDAIPYIIAEIPTNPRVEVPDLEKLKATLSKVRHTSLGTVAIDPVFILDQTFCPNVNFLGEGAMLSTIRTISYASGSKFPSGGLCTAGYCVGNNKTDDLMSHIAVHIRLCDNEATDLQIEILAKQLPSMNQRIADAYHNTRSFVHFIQETLPSAKINFVSEALALQGFTPSVFSLDLPTKGNSLEEKEDYKRALNHTLIHLMITEIPDESKYCVSYGQLKGCYWTIPATSTQGTTKEGDKDYIARVALSPMMNLELHKKVFKDFVDKI